MKLPGRKGEFTELIMQLRRTTYREIVIGSKMRLKLIDIAIGPTFVPLCKEELKVRMEHLEN